ncbi:MULTISPECIES: helix-turn-helix transcriptional regulator [unclassified Actinopolyspora]|uniref:helix-turn-helix domain-containing protein n=1 Tax=unclassified Actinopolyspora TaxID=2639451 RepID=UPI0013F5D385|nr:MULTISPECIES: helix-turn-helix transcriptional regulator [unclassified Actinopolyspora]NHD18442.1 helix-turn-helix domain-containing protein [Actinopolyspora sp. BKK2]NHE77599.1 helix-turn-helix domain-containing protein [Actinopolyspora sp. BKK1]
MTNEAQETGSVVRRWQLAETLRRAREEAGLTHDQVIAELRRVPGKWSRPKLSRIENRAQGIKAREVEQLLDIYGVVDSSLRGWLLELATTARARGWAVDMRKNLPEDFHTFFNMEGELVALRQFETLLVPGLLQTPEYARSIISGVNPGLTEEEVERRVTARMARQRVLERATPPQLHVIIDEALLDRHVGPLAVMRPQLVHLNEVAERSNVTLQVLPKSSGASPALEGPFSVLTPPAPMPDIGYSEGPGRAVYIEDRDDVRSYTLRFGTLTEQAFSADDSRKRIEQAILRCSPHSKETHQ